MCSKNGTPVSKLDLPVPSRLISTEIWVSRVFRSTRALRSAMETPSRKQACYCKYSIRRLYPLTQPESRNRRSEEHTSELQSRPHLVCRLLLEKKNRFERHE